MTGQQMYEITRKAAQHFYCERLPDWSVLDWKTQQRWEDVAVEQGLRDQPESDRLQHDKKGL